MTEPKVRVYPSVKEREALLGRILTSPHFARSARLRDFLSYIVEQAVSNPEESIHEADIAERVYGRKDGPAGDDSIVRVHASQLRKRLAQYFHAEGASESLILDVPKGQYLPVFLQREVLPDEPPAPTIIPAPLTSVPWVMIAAVVSVVVIAFALLLWDDLRLRNASRPTAGPMLERFWSAFADSSIPADIVLADSSLAVVQQMAGKRMKLEEYANKEYQVLIDAIPPGSAVRPFADVIMHRRYTSIVDADLTRKLSALLPHKDRVSSVHARDFQPIHLRSDHVILLGSTQANPWVMLIEPQLDFRYTYEVHPAKTLIQNQKPRSGEKSLYDPSADQAGGVLGGYCLVARVPNLGGRAKVLLIAGTETEATGAGGEFLLSETSLGQLGQSLGMGPRDAFPDFEALLATSRVGGSSPATRLVAVHRH
jgi:hypothetical protein